MSDIDEVFKPDVRMWNDGNYVEVEKFNNEQEKQAAHFKQKLIEKHDVEASAIKLDRFLRGSYKVVFIFVGDHQRYHYNPIKKAFVGVRV